jgi:hypothetical protein
MVPKLAIRPARGKSGRRHLPRSGIRLVDRENPAFRKPSDFVPLIRKRHFPNMKTRLPLLLSFLIACGVRGEEVTFISRVDGVRYEAVLESETVKRTGGFFSYRKDEGQNRKTYLSEPAGIPLPEAMGKADAVAKRILGKGLEGDDHRWVLKSAEKAEAENEAGYYYHFSYSTRDGAYSDPEWLGPDGTSRSSSCLTERSSNPNASKPHPSDDSPSQTAKYGSPRTL